jgi:uncharacterized protein YbbC (DUF1343 family)
MNITDMRKFNLCIICIVVGLIALAAFLVPTGERDVEANVTFSPQDKFELGNEVLLGEKIDLIKDKNIGIITNTSGVVSDGRLFVDLLLQSESLNPVKIFSPEHGFEIDDKDVTHVNKRTGLEVVSLYGNKKKPSSGDLSNVDVLIYDIQDVGARFYTFINTMYYCMEAATENNVKFIVCDRPVIPDADYVDGFMLEDNVKSFVGLLDIPIAYGMTSGELARFINAEYLGNTCDLEVVEMKNYSRSMKFDDLGITWVKPSPSMYFHSTAGTYQGTCLFEGTNFAEGRGTDRPFEYVGAPYCNGSVLKEAMDKYSFEGVTFEAIEFTPSSITSPSNPPKYVDQNCSGIFINVTDAAKFQPVKVGIALLVELNDNFPGFNWRNDNYIDKLAGTKQLRQMVSNGTSYQDILAYYSADLEQFKERRKKYLLYN